MVRFDLRTARPCGTGAVVETTDEGFLVAVARVFRTGSRLRGGDASTAGDGAATARVVVVLPLPLRGRCCGDSSGEENIGLLE